MVLRTLGLIFLIWIASMANEAFNQLEYLCRVYSIQSSSFITNSSFWKWSIRVLVCLFIVAWFLTSSSYSVNNEEQI